MNRTAHEHDLPDAELVKRARGGDPAAFGELVARYQDRVYNTCYRMCHNEADALDLTQETFLRAFQALAKYQSRASFYTWLFRIAVNLTISARRSSRRRPRVSLDQPQDDGGTAAGRVPAGSSDAGQALEHRERHERIAGALDRLDDEFRIPVVLKDIEDMDYASIAEVLDVPVGTVKSRIHRGRMMLRDFLKEADHVESRRA